MNITLKIAFTLLLFLTTPLAIWADDRVSNDDVIRYVNLRSAIYSWVPGDILSTHRKHSSGRCSNGGVVNIGVSNFSTTIRCLPDREQLGAEVSIKPDPSNKDRKATKSVIDMSDMRQKAIELFKNDDGRVFFLVITPEILEAKQPEAFTVEHLRSFDWDFQESPVVLNDETYIGRIGMSGGSLCGITISGVDDLEFSLKHIKNAEPIGLLQRGTLTIKKDDAVITISGVRNGAQKVTLDGPYKVWVRSTGKDVKGKAFLEMMAVQIAAMRERKSEGDATLTDEMMKKVTQMVDKKRPMLMSAFTTDVKDRDLEK